MTLIKKPITINGFCISNNRIGVHNGKQFFYLFFEKVLIHFSTFFDSLTTVLISPKISRMKIYSFTSYL